MIVRRSGTGRVVGVVDGSIYERVDGPILVAAWDIIVRVALLGNLAK